MVPAGCSAVFCGAQRAVGPLPCSVSMQRIQPPCCCDSHSSTVSLHSWTRCHSQAAWMRKTSCMQASTDTEPRRDKGQQARQARPRTPVGQQDDKFDFGKFLRGDLPGKLGMLLVSPLYILL